MKTEPRLEYPDKLEEHVDILADRLKTLDEGSKQLIRIEIRLAYIEGYYKGMAHCQKSMDESLAKGAEI